MSNTMLSVFTHSINMLHSSILSAFEVYLEFHFNKYHFNASSPKKSTSRFQNAWKWYMKKLKYYFIDLDIITIAKSLQSCPTPCDPIDGSPPGFPIPGILQARTLEWVAISFSDAWKWKVKVKSLSHVRPSATPWTAAFQAPPTMGFSRLEYWSGVPLSSPLDIIICSKWKKVCL